jgi:hypothetical protein
VLQRSTSVGAKATLLLLGWICVAKAQIYGGTDADGAVYFGDTKPPSGQVEKIDVQSLPPSGDANSANRRQQELERELKRMAEARRQKLADRQKEKANRAAMCSALRSRIDRLTRDDYYYYRLDGGGNRVWLSTKEMDKHIDALREQERRACGLR